MDAHHWIIGPQLIGIILLVAGCIQKRWPPKKINHMYGYRTPSSMQSQKAWDCANCYSASHMIKSGFILIIAGTLFNVVVGLLSIPEEAQMLISGIALVAVAIATCILLVIYTEKHLKKHLTKTLNS